MLILKWKKEPNPNVRKGSKFVKVPASILLIVFLG